MLKEAAFSRGFEGLTTSEPPGWLEEALVERTLEGHLAGHASHDPKAFPERERPQDKSANLAQTKNKRGRRNHGKEPH